MKTPTPTDPIPRDPTYPTHPSHPAHPAYSTFFWFVSAAAAFIATMLLHLPVTDALAALVTAIGLANYDLLVSAAAVGMGIVTMGAIGWREEWRLTPVTASAVVLLAFVALAQALLIIAPAEYVHFPQYALIAFLVGRSGLPLEPVWLGTVGLGAVDEAFQFLLLRRGRPDYFDWNDIVLNAIGGAYGIVLVLAGTRLPSRLSMSRRQVTATMSAAVAAALVFAPVTLTPFLTLSPRGRSFRVLSAFEAVALLGLLWLCVRWVLGRRR